MKEALIIFLVGLILGTNFAHSTTTREVNQLIADSEFVIHRTEKGIPMGWGRMNLEAEIENYQDALKAALPTAPASKHRAIEVELKRLEAALHLVLSEA